MQFWNEKQSEPDNGLLGVCMYLLWGNVHTVCILNLHITIKQHLLVKDVNTFTHTRVEDKNRLINKNVCEVY